MLATTTTSAATSTIVAVYTVSREQSAGCLCTYSPYANGLHDGPLQQDERGVRSKVLEPSSIRSGAY